MLRPGSFLSKFVALSILVLLLLVAGQFIIQPMIGLYRSHYDRIVDAKEQQQRYRALAAERSVLAERMERFEVGAKTTTSYLEGPSDALAAAQLQDLVSATITQSGGAIKTTQILTASDVEDGPPLRKAGLILQFTIELDGFAQALDDLETMEPQLFIANLNIGLEHPTRLNKRISEGRRQEAAKAKANAAKIFNVRLSVFGYVRQRT